MYQNWLANAGRRWNDCLDCDRLFWRRLFNVSFQCTVGNFEKKGTALRQSKLREEVRIIQKIIRTFLYTTPNAFLNHNHLYYLYLIPLAVFGALLLEHAR